MTATTPKLKIWRTAIETYAVVFRNLGFLARAGWVWLLLAVVLLTGLDYLAARLGYGGGGSTFDFSDFTHWIAQSLFQGACLAAFAVAWHQRILHSPTATTALPAMSLVLQYALFALALDAAFTLTCALPRLGSSADASSLRLAAIAAITLLAFYLWCRAMFLLPAIAIGADRSLDTAWRNTNGNGWRLAASFVLTGLLAFIGSLPVTAIFLMLTDKSERAALFNRQPEVWNLVGIISGNTLTVVFAVIALAFLSIAYRDLVLKRADAIIAPA
jgi:hypothetical protein